ncbi:STAS domain-containing protein [Rubrobacter calidifluminis]|uniref:STAS domain-containing protein n=1 Tax=Rubrobacter calidifluminis TaxID=1392640 RepID=UPI002362F88B|nr:STAS domain-containing protein [Rubrobacter calidifluminis]
MDFEVTLDEHAAEYSVIAVRGEVDLHTAPKLKYAIERGANGGVRAIVLDISGVEFMDSTALSTFMRVHDSLKEKGVALRLASPSRAVERIFEVTGFGDYFEVYPSREEAISRN